jgi:hypothetical protein
VFSSNPVLSAPHTNAPSHFVPVTNVPEVIKGWILNDTFISFSHDWPVMEEAIKISDLNSIFMARNSTRNYFLFSFHWFCLCRDTSRY